MAFYPLIPCISCLLCGLVFGRAIQQIWYDELMKSYFVDSNQDVDQKLYSCHYSKARCCRCDVNCSLRRDCCLDKYYWEKPMPPGEYVETLLQRYSKVLEQCEPIVKVARQHQVESIVMISKCHNKNSLHFQKCKNHRYHDNFPVISNTGDVYVSMACALCNGPSNYKLLDIKISGCSPLLKDDGMGLNLTRYEKCTFNAVLPGKITCPFQKYRKFDDKSNCQPREIDLCQSYLALVSDQYGTWSNVHCKKCSSVSTTPKAVQAGCTKTLKKDLTWTFPDGVDYLITSQFSNFAQFTNRNGSTKKVDICPSGRVFDFLSGNCVKFRCTTENSMLLPNCSSGTGNKENVSMTTRITCSIFFGLTIPLLLFTIFTYAFIKSLFDTFGKIIICICLLLLVIDTLGLLALHLDVSPLVRCNFAIVLHWAVICKHLWVTVLVINLFRNMPPHRKSKQEQHFDFAFYNVTLWIVSFIFIIVCATTDGDHKVSMQYGYWKLFLFGNVYGWLSLLFAPVCIMHVINFIVLMVIYNIHWRKVSGNLSIKADMEYFGKCLQITVLLVVIVSVPELSGLIYFYELHENDSLVFSILQMTYCVLQTTQGIFIFCILILRQSVLFFYRWYIEVHITGHHRPRRIVSKRDRLEISGVLKYDVEMESIIDNLSIMETDRSGLKSYDFECI